MLNVHDRVTILNDLLIYDSTTETVLLIYASAMVASYQGVGRAGITIFIIYWHSSVYWPSPPVPIQSSATYSYFFSISSHLVILYSQLLNKSNRCTSQTLQFRSSSLKVVRQRWKSDGVRSGEQGGCGITARQSSRVLNSRSMRVCVMLNKKTYGTHIPNF